MKALDAIGFSLAFVLCAYALALIVITVLATIECLRKDKS